MRTLNMLLSDLLEDVLFDLVHVEVVPFELLHVEPVEAAVQEKILAHLVVPRHDDVRKQIVEVEGFLPDVEDDLLEHAVRDRRLDDALGLDLPVQVLDEDLLVLLGVQLGIDALEPVLDVAVDRGIELVDLVDPGERRGKRPGTSYCPP